MNRLKGKKTTNSPSGSHQMTN